MKDFNKIKESILVRNRVSASVVITLKKINATFRVKSRGLLVGVFTRMLPAIGLRKTLSRIRTILIFINRCKHIANTQGVKGLVNWLKANTVLLQQSLGGFKLHDVTLLKSRPARTKCGLPRLVLSADRALMRAGNIKTMRFYLTLFNLYRVLDFKGSLKLGTITDGFKGRLDPGGVYFRVISYIPAFVKMLRAVIKTHKVPELKSYGIETPTILKSSPQTAMGQISTTPEVLALSAYGLRRIGLDGVIMFFIKYFEKGTKIPYPGLMTIFEGAASLPLDLPSYNLAVSALGKLGFKEEAAGKVRVFAMCDAWTQWVMGPFHSWIFAILAKIPMDGTFDQMAPVRDVAKTCKSAYSLDLSAATDRLPMSVQVMLYANLVDPTFAINWCRLLVGRGYLATSEKYKVSEILTYTVGQPMGALSSWGSLAITHHFIVQCSAWDAGVVPVGTWFIKYAVLGDDLVIFDQRVKESYLRIVDALGVECGIAKSLLSSRGTAIEFAKRTLYRGIDVSPIPLKEFVVVNLTLADAVAYARKYHLTFAQLIKTLGYGYRVLGSLNKHVGTLNSRVRALLFAFYLPASEADVTEALFRGNPLISQDQLKLVVASFKELLMGRYYKMIEARLKNLPSTPEIIKSRAAAATSALLNRHGMSVPVVFRNLEITWKPLKDVKAVWVENPVTATDVTVVANSVQTSLDSLEYRKTESLIRDITLTHERIVKLLVNKPMANFRASASDLLWDIKGLRFNRSLYTVYLASIRVLREISLIGDGVINFERRVEALPWKSDPIAARYWRDFTKCILSVVKPRGGK